MEVKYKQNYNKVFTKKLIEQIIKSRNWLTHIWLPDLQQRTTSFQTERTVFSINCAGPLGTYKGKNKTDLYLKEYIKVIWGRW